MPAARVPAPLTYCGICCSDLYAAALQNTAGVADGTVRVWTTCVSGVQVT